MSKLNEINQLGQAIWLDYIRRSLLTSGELRELIDAGVCGVTSNPTIFQKAVAAGADYDGDIERLAAKGKQVEEIYEDLVLADITSACDLLRPLYDSTQGGDGYVSLEVDPGLARDVQGTIDEATRLFAAVGRPNLMIKVPATAEGIPAIEALTAEGVNVNATLIFSIESYESVATAYISGLERYCDTGRDPSRVASVASLFVSRVDTAVDKELDKLGRKELKGKAAVANAVAAYARFKEIFGGDRWKDLAAKGARAQRPLWASTGTKNPDYSDVLYVENLMGPETVNTLPPATLNALMDHGKVAPTLESGLDEARSNLSSLEEAGVDLRAVTERLLEDGVKAFSESFDSLHAVIAAKREQLLARGGLLTSDLGAYSEAVDSALRELASDRIMERIWSHDHTVWRPDPKEIENRLGWLEAPGDMIDRLDAVDELCRQVRRDGYTHALLLGMGGSSLAAEVIRKTLGVREGFLDLEVLDTTDPGAIRGCEGRHDLSRTLFIVASKSGTTVESMSLFKYFFNRVAELKGDDRAGQSFVAVTDPGGKLADLAREHSFRQIFLNDPDVGGRYSALTYFGLVPAALCGADLRLLLDRAATAACRCGGAGCAVKDDNPASRLGSTMAVLARAGRDKLTLVMPPSMESFGSWAEQLIAESTGKDGRGILPVVGEKLGPPDLYEDDRVFVQLRLKDDRAYDLELDALKTAGHPVVVIDLEDSYDLGGQFFLWETATAVSGHLLDIQPFDQPDVDSAKRLAREMVSAYKESGELPDDGPETPEPGALREFLSQGRRGDYIAIQAFITPCPENDEILDDFRLVLRKRHRLATTVGYGPRYLHSTGQLHKGDRGNGLFVQLTCDDARDLPIPDEAGSQESSVGFSVLKMSQAKGDRRALLEAGRRVIKFHLGENQKADLESLVDAIDAGRAGRPGA